MYKAWLCYPQTYDLDDDEPVIKFEEPQSWEYDKIIPIQFSVLHQWSKKEKALYR